jgi:hypothetical protein
MKKNILGIAVAVLLLFGCATKTPSSSASSSSAPDSVSDQSSAVSSVAVRHSIQAKVLAGEGSLEFSKTSAERGETITVDVKAGESDKLEKIASDQVSLSLIQEGLQYSFVMPDEDVTIQVSFRARESFRVIDILDFASKPVGITGLTVGDSVLEGTETTVTVRRISFAAEQKPLLIQAMTNSLPSTLMTKESSRGSSLSRVRIPILPSRMIPAPRPVIRSRTILRISITSSASIRTELPESGLLCHRDSGSCPQRHHREGKDERKGYFRPKGSAGKSGILPLPSVFSFGAGGDLRKAL